jgi:hypothetical protein
MAMQVQYFSSRAKFAAHVCARISPTDEHVVQLGVGRLTHEVRVDDAERRAALVRTLLDDDQVRAHRIARQIMGMA